MEDVNAALSTGFLQKGHTKNSLSKAYSIKGKLPNVNPKATFNKKIKSTYTIKIKLFIIKLFLILIADAFYHLGEFEKSLMFYYRALHKCQIGSEGEEIR